MHSSIRIGLVTEHPIFCTGTGVTQALSSVANLAVVAHGRSPEDALQMASHAGPDVLLLEIEIPGLGIAALGAICSTNCNAKSWC